MQDPRIAQLAEQLIHYSVSLQKGERLLIDLQDTPDEMGIALIRAARAVGAYPHLRTVSTRLNREMLMGAEDAQYECIGKLMLEEMKEMDAYIAIRGSNNVTETSDVPSDKMNLAMKHLRPALNWRVGKTKWCGLRWPTSSMAQLSSMSTEAFEKFYFDVCLLDYPKLAPVMEELRELMEATDEVRIVGEGTDITFSIKGMPALPCCGNYNIPDGEVYTAPVIDSANGVITYNCPTIYQGIAFDGIVLEFKNGKIVRAEAGDKTEALNKILDVDDGARYIGEFALGINPLILNPMRDILFDEKIAGSFHFTPGQAYENCDNGNRSQNHWDMVCIQRPEYGGGEIYFDGKLIRKDGKFLDPRFDVFNAR